MYTVFVYTVRMKRAFPPDTKQQNTAESRWLLRDRNAYYFIIHAIFIFIISSNTRYENEISPNRPLHLENFWKSKRNALILYFELFESFRVSWNYIVCLCTGTRRGVYHLVGMKIRTLFISFNTAFRLCNLLTPLLYTTLGGRPCLLQGKTKNARVGIHNILINCRNKFSTLSFPYFTKYLFFLILSRIITIHIIQM